MMYYRFIRYFILFGMLFAQLGITTAANSGSLDSEIYYLASHYLDKETESGVKFDRPGWYRRFAALDKSAVGRMSKLMPSETEANRVFFMMMTEQMIGDSRCLPGDQERFIAAVKSTLSMKGGVGKTVALRILLKSKNFKDASAILPLFGDDDVDVRASAARLLKEIGTVEILPGFERMLRAREEENARTKPAYDGSVLMAKEAIKAIRARAQSKPTATQSVPAKNSSGDRGQVEGVWKVEGVGPEWH